MSTTPAPIDARGPRLNQAALTIGLLAAFLFDLPLLALALGVNLGLGAAFGPRWNVFLRLFADVVKPRLGPPADVEDPRPPRFAATVGTLFLAAATLAFVAGASTAAWALVLVVALLAGLAASTGICVGCEIYATFARRRGVRAAG